MKNPASKTVYFRLCSGVRFWALKKDVNAGQNLKREDLEIKHCYCASETPLVLKLSLLLSLFTQLLLFLDPPVMSVIILYMHDICLLPG